MTRTVPAMSNVRVTQKLIERNPKDHRLKHLNIMEQYVHVMMYVHAIWFVRAIVCVHAKAIKRKGRMVHTTGIHADLSDFVSVDIKIADSI